MSGKLTFKKAIVWPLEGLEAFAYTSPHLTVPLTPRALAKDASASYCR
jgi:hypothetical protein